MTDRSSLLRETGKRLLLVAPAAVIILALTQKWYWLKGDLGLYRTRYPLTPDAPKITLAVCIAYIVFAAVFGLRWRWATALLSLALSVVALTTLVVGRNQIDLSAAASYEWEQTRWYGVALTAGAAWFALSLALMVLPSIAARFHVPPPSPSSPIERSTGLRPTVWVGIASAVAMVLGAFGPWAKVLTLGGGLSISGTDGDGDGWVVVVAAALGVLAIVGSARRQSISLALTAALLGVFSTYVCAHDRHNIGSFDDSDVGVNAGWGLNLALIASIVLTLSALLLIRRKRMVTSATESYSPRPVVAYAAGPLAPSSSEPPGTFSAADLDRLVELHERGSLTDEEFTQAKRRLLSD